MGLLIRMTNGNYTNANAVENVLRYITRTRESENRRQECIVYSGKGIAAYRSVDFIIKQMEYVQHMFGIDHRRGRRIYHEVFNICEEEFVKMGRNIDVLYRFAEECAQYYFEAGHQVVFAIHGTNGNDMHIHFAVNTINFVNGSKWHDSKLDLLQRNELFDRILRKYQFMFVMSVS